jgi:hypothetical protein
MSKYGISVDRKKVEAVVNWERSTNVHEIRIFFWVCPATIGVLWKIFQNCLDH